MLGELYWGELYWGELYWGSYTGGAMLGELYWGELYWGELYWGSYTGGAILGELYWGKGGEKMTPYLPLRDIIPSPSRLDHGRHKEHVCDCGEVSNFLQAVEP